MIIYWKKLTIKFIENLSKTLAGQKAGQILEDVCSIQSVLRISWCNFGLVYAETAMEKRPVIFTYQRYMYMGFVT